MISSNARASFAVLVVTGAAVCAPACSGQFHACEETRTCPPVGGNSGSSGTAGSLARGGSSGSLAHAGDTSSRAGNGDAGEHSGGEGGEGASEDSGGERGASAPGGAGGAGGTPPTAGSGGTLPMAGSGGTLPMAGSGGNLSVPPVDQVPPTILSITPVNDATKLTLESATITITFNEPMNKASAESSFVPAGSAPAPTFSWNTAATELKIRPNLTYPAATDPTAVAQPFKFTITTAAKDLAGNPLGANVSWQFTLLREITQSLPYSYEDGGNWESGATVTRRDISAGDYSDNGPVRGFMTYDISQLPPGINAFESATIDTRIKEIKGDPFGLFGNLYIQSLSYSIMNQAAYDAPPLHDLGTFMASTGSKLPDDAVSKEVLSALSDDYTNRLARNNKSQYRLIFASSPSLNAKNDFITLNASVNVNKLTVRYLFP